METAKLLRLLHKDPSAGMEQLINQYAGLVYAVVKGKLAASSCVSTEIEDCVADVFSEFYFDRNSFDPKKSSLKTYLCVLARNNAIDLLRRREKQHGAVSIEDVALLQQIADDVTLESELAQDELRREVFYAVKALGEPDNTILLRKYYLGESSKEIADTLGLTVSNVDTRTHRALNKLRKMFGGDPE